jgi:hypothetical protein
MVLAIARDLPRYEASSPTLRAELERDDLWAAWLAWLRQTVGRSGFTVQ